MPGRGGLLSGKPPALCLVKCEPSKFSDVSDESFGGLRPSFSSYVRLANVGHPYRSVETAAWCDPGSDLVRICGDRFRLEGESCGIPHLAKNERDMGARRLWWGRT